MVMAGLVPAIPADFLLQDQRCDWPHAAGRSGACISIEAELPLNFGHNSHRQWRARALVPRARERGLSMIDLYQLLGIKRAATREEIRKAYRRKAKNSHPDRGGSAEAFNALSAAHDVLSDARRRERYDSTGENEQARPDNFDGTAIEVIAQKLGLLIHAEHDVTELDIDAVLAQTIRDDIGLRKTSIANQQRAMARAATLRARVKRKGNGADNALARVLDWHASSAKDSVRKNEDAVRAMERALEILDLYSFAENRAPVPLPAEEEVSEALHDALRALDELAAIFNTQAKVATS